MDYIICGFFYNSEIFCIQSKRKLDEEYLKCCTTWVFSYMINAGLLEIIVKVLHINVFIAQIIATLSAAVFTYILFKKFAFRAKA